MLLHIALTALACPWPDQIKAQINLFPGTPQSQGYLIVGLDQCSNNHVATANYFHSTFLNDCTRLEMTTNNGLPVM
jgi:hypothetical protein